MHIPPRHFPALSIALLLPGLFATAAHASLLFSDSFAYPTGPLAGNINHGAAWISTSGSIPISSPGSSYPGLVTAGNKAIISDHSAPDAASIALPGTAGGSGGSSQVWLSFLFNQQLATPYAPDGYAVVTLANGGNAISVGMVNRTDHYGIDNNNGTSPALTSTTPGPTAQRIVADFDFSTGKEYLWINPALNSIPSTASAGAALAMPSALQSSGFASIGLAASDTIPPSFDVDELALGTTYADVTSLLGDANGDGTVDLNDLNIVLNHLGLADTSRGDGNFDNASTIDLTDLNDVLNHLGTGIPAPSIPAPEPASLAWVAFAAPLFLRRVTLRRGGVRWGWRGRLLRCW
jgi:hypothetical protein